MVEIRTLVGLEMKPPASGGGAGGFLFCNCINPKRPGLGMESTLQLIDK
jgi:hypothetical protein